jgi:RNA polymerase sigma factor (sigma-70 family)
MRTVSKTTTTTQLVADACSGSADAFTELVRRNQDWAYAAALSVLGDPARAQDAVQDAFLAAFGNLHSLRAPEAFGIWLRQIVRYQASRILRSQPRDVPFAAQAPALSPDPAEVALQREDLRFLMRAINALPEGERDAIVLFYLKDHSQKKVATLLQLPVSTVNNRLHAARARLRGELLPMMETILARHRLPTDFAERLGQIVRAEGAVQDAVPRILSRLGAQRTGAEPVETGIKVIDLLCPIGDGGAIGLFGDPRVGKLVLVEELIHNLGRERRHPVIFTFVKAPEEVEVFSKLLADAGPIPTVVIAAEEASERAVLAAQPFVGASVFMSRQLAEGGIYPAVDVRRSSSRLLDPAFIGADHFEVAQRVLAALAHVDAPNALGARARRIRNFLSQPFFVAEPYTKRPGTFVPLRETLGGFKGLLSGAYDKFPEEAFLMRGSLDMG